MLINPVDPLLMGAIFLVFHYWLKWDLKYLNSLPGAKIFNERIELKIQNNEKLTLRDKANIFYKKMFDLIISVSGKVGWILIILGVILKIFSMFS